MRWGLQPSLKEVETHPKEKPGTEAGSQESGLEGVFGVETKERKAPATQHQAHPTCEKVSDKQSNTMEA